MQASTDQLSKVADWLQNLEQLIFAVEFNTSIALDPDSSA